MSDSQVASAQAQAVHQAEVQQMPLVSGLMLLGVIVASIAVFEYLGYKVLGLGAEVFFASFTLLWYWATVEKAEFSGLPASVIGALVGVALAWQSGWCVGRFGMPMGLIIGLVPVVIALFLVIMNWVPLAFNGSAMLFLTILGAKAFATAGTNYILLTKAIVLGAIFFAAVIWVAKLYVDWRTKAKLGAAARQSSSKQAVSA
jgi:hypothetical protein